MRRRQRGVYRFDNISHEPHDLSETTMPRAPAAFTLFATLLTAVPASHAATAADSWNEVLERVIPSVVSLQVNETRYFEMDYPGNSVGTGFVVDVEQGLILTNRHLVSAGPVVTEAVFVNDEEVPLEAVYRDPVHDFGFYRFDPAALKYLQPPALPLVPEAAKVGADIRIIGNDDGEKIMILDGTLARLDREAPSYSGYTDFNTFYIQAAAGTSGGSSGSPVINVKGQVLALNAGTASDRASSSFFLPLDRVVRALRLIQEGQVVTRGTLQAVFQHTPYDELVRLGLSEGAQQQARQRFPAGRGLLVVEQVVPGGPADGTVLPGDILIEVNKTPIASFAPLEGILDAHVGKKVSILLERGGTRHEIELTVDDLHSLMPTSFVEFGAGLLHEVNYQMARKYNLPAEGVALVYKGYAWGNAGIPSDVVIRSVGNTPILSLDDLYTELARRAHLERVPIRYFPLNDRHAAELRTLQVDRFWFPFKRCRLDERGNWPCEEAGEPPAAATAEVQKTDTSVGGPPPLQALGPSIVKVKTTLPANYIEGTGGVRFTGHGLVVDAERGWVITDRDAVPLPVGDISITVARSVRVAAEVVLVHPIHNLALIRYDPALLGDTVLKSARLDPKQLASSDKVWQVGFNSNGDYVALETLVSRIAPVNIGTPDWASFQAVNVDVVHTRDNDASSGGVLCDRRGRVHALWATFFRDTSEDGRLSENWGIPIRVVQALLEQMRAGEEPRSLAAQFSSLSLTAARDRGLSQTRVDAIERKEPVRRRVLTVDRTVAGTQAATLLSPGDLVLAANGSTVTRFEHLDAVSQAAQVELTLLRDGAEIQVVVPTLSLVGQSLDRLAFWAGLVLHDPHWEVATQQGQPRTGVYVAWYFNGSPGKGSGVRPVSRIIAVDGEKVTDLQTFLSLVAAKKDREPVRLTLVDELGKTYVRTLKVDQRYWSTRVFVQSETGWSLAASSGSD